MKPDIPELIERINEVSITKRSELVGGERVEGEDHVKENLILLKKLAPQHWETIVSAFHATADIEKKISLCEVLQATNETGLIPFFESLLNDENNEIRDCALIALARLGYANLAPYIKNSLDESPSRRRKYHAGLALLQIGDPQGLDVLISILKEEQAFVSVANGYAKSESREAVFCFFIHNLLSVLTGLKKKTPFDWIHWWETANHHLNRQDMLKVPSHMLEYFHEYQ